MNKVSKTFTGKFTVFGLNKNMSNRIFDPGSFKIRQRNGSPHIVGKIPF